jgi:hypothetical protein
MNDHGHPWRDLPRHEVTDPTVARPGDDTAALDGQAPADVPRDGYVPVDVTGVIVTGPAWARRPSRTAARLRPARGILGRGLGAAMWAAVAVSGALILTGNAEIIGLSDTGTGSRRFQLVIIAVAVLVIGAIAGDVFDLGRRNRRARTDRLRVERARRARVRAQLGRRRISDPGAIDGINLRDDHDLAHTLHDA